MAARPGRRENNQPTAQFYHIATDNEFPFRLYGDQQDNTSISIATAGRAGGVGIEDWYPVGGGESGFIIPDPTDAEYRLWRRLRRGDHPLRPAHRQNTRDHALAAQYHGLGGQESEVSIPVDGADHDLEI